MVVSPPALTLLEDKVIVTYESSHHVRDARSVTDVRQSTTVNVSAVLIFLKGEELKILALISTAPRVKFWVIAESVPVLDSELWHIDHRFDCRRFGRRATVGWAPRGHIHINADFVITLEMPAAATAREVSSILHEP